MTRQKLFFSASSLFVLTTLFFLPSAAALNGGTLRVNPRNGWSAFEVISIGDNPTGDGFEWSMPGTFDGLGALLRGSSTLRVQVNHENTDATISEVDLDLSKFKMAISNTINGGNTLGGSFVTSARQAYDRWSGDGGATWTSTTGISNTNFYRFCSGQSYVPNTFGVGRGFVDDVYITGEEGSTSRLFALDLDDRDFSQLSGVAGSASGGLGGMPFDPWENAALLDTGETDHVALLLSPDGGSSRMQIYIGEKGKDASGSAANDFLARNGLAYGSYYYLNGVLPSSAASTAGTFDTTSSGALTASKLEDVDTSPSNPTRAVLGNQNFGVFTFDFDLDFDGGSFRAVESAFTLTEIQDHHTGVHEIGNADNVEWSAPTVLDGKTYAEGLIFVNEDHADGEIWMNAPDGSDLTLIGDTAGIPSATESSGILDISDLVGYNPGSILLTSNQGSDASLSVLINPDATLDDADFDIDDDIDGADFLTWQRNIGSGTLPSQGDAGHDGSVAANDLAVWEAQFGSAPPLSMAIVVPEPSRVCLMLLAGLMASISFRPIENGLRQKRIAPWQKRIAPWQKQIAPWQKRKKAATARATTSFL